ncbi:ABC transporter ATP-binding protein [Streptomonospora salina]|uniref:Fluoroquinolone transport system ATP-binding protein n=1 Tax=Streptomonospora salina TaxID=104205 RepID=A0A841EBS6_9ACTN|nr:ABC transporter ATP-binding protein [Streptomonospora salina]MBB6000512.1 fluoroquinolone transport system ATP-binding protein [Streptomonospora salina]
MDGAGTPVIDVEDLRVRYRGADADAVAGMAFAVAPGEVFGFLGPSGAGKSTVQRVLTRLLRGYSGRAAVFGRPLDSWGADYFERIGVGFELPVAFGKLTAAENLTAVARLYRRPPPPVRELLEAVDLAGAAERRVDGFSKGMRMRLNLARALVTRPDLLFLDEPTSGQDPVHAAALREVIRDQARQGTTVFLTTHDMTTADRLCDRVAFVVDGRIAAVDSPRAFKLRYGRPGVRVEYRVDGRLDSRQVPLDALTADPGLADLLARGAVETVHTREASLDDVFATVTEARL